MKCPLLPYLSVLVTTITLLENNGSVERNLCVNIPFVPGIPLLEMDLYEIIQQKDKAKSWSL